MNTGISHNFGQAGRKKTSIPTSILVHNLQWYPHGQPHHTNTEITAHLEKVIRNTHSKTDPTWKRQQWSLYKQYPNIINPCKNSRKEFSKYERSYFGDHLQPNFNNTDILIGFINIQSIHKSIRGEKNFDLMNLISDIRFGHIGIAETRRH